MPELLIHSMSEFSEIILGVLQAAQAREIVEIGAEFGGVSAMLADHVADRGGRLTSVDPCPKQAFVDWAAAHPDVRHMAMTSIAAFPHLSDVDAWLIDGDHNWYTVFNELAQVDAICKRDGKPLLAILHDVAWPCARRDMYYAPDQVPECFRHPYSYEGGVTLDEPGLLPNQGLRGMGRFAFAEREGGARNGVLTAVEDFLQDQHDAGRELCFAEIPAVFGLGVLFDLDASWSSQVAELVLPYHDNKLLRALEQNRLRNYLRVIEMQDASPVSDRTPHATHP